MRPSNALLCIPDTSQVSSSNTSTDSPQFNGADDDLEKGNNADDLTPHSGIRLHNTQSVPVDLLEVGDVVRIRHGASPPADGTIVNEAGTVFDESSLTGESKLVKKEFGDKVYVGTINKGSVVDVRVDAIGGETMYVTLSRFNKLHCAN